MRVGCLGYSHARGLGHLLHDFYKHEVVTDVCVVRHPNIPMTDWYPDAPIVDLRRIDHSTVYEFMARMDVMLFFETPFEWTFINYCRLKNAKTAIVPMYECTPSRFATLTKNHIEVPDLWICPSLLDVDYFKHFNHTFIPMPVEYPWKLRERAETFVHNGGYLGLKGREGTVELIKAMEHVKSPLKLTIRVQENVNSEMIARMKADPRITYVPETVPYEELYGSGDVCIAPQRFNGMSCPLQEARASGMLVMTTNRYPMNTWLPQAPLLPVEKTERGRVGGSYMEMDICTLNPRDIAVVMDRWYGQDITEYSMTGKKWAEENSWRVLRPQIMEALENLL